MNCSLKIIIGILVAIVAVVVGAVSLAVSLVTSLNAIDNVGAAWSNGLSTGAHAVLSNTFRDLEDLIVSALTNPDDWDALRVQLRALVPDFHVPPPPPPTEELEQHAAGEARKLHLA